MALALANTNWLREVRTLLVLGRVSNLPTVWSNCLAGWLLSGGGSYERFALLCAGASCLYLGGMFLNDAFDSDFDRQYRKERPIPSGAISLGKVWGWGLGWLLAGVLFLSLLGPPAATAALLLAICIVLYDAIHKAVTLSPSLMAGCRFLLYVLASASAADGIVGLGLWSGLAMALYTWGLSLIARRESLGGQARLWPTVLMATPILLAAVVNGSGYELLAFLLSLLCGCWIVYCLSHTFWGTTANIGRTVSGLLAGICLIDLLAVAGQPPGIAIVFLALFVAALVGQRFVPAT
ncbi:MAG: UbiA family prenyltransferase [Verrucomicrobiia bacterium]